VIITKLTESSQAIALPLKIVVLAKGKKAITNNKNKVDCFNNLEIISTGEVNRYTS
jgi:hypothetical protein